MSVIDVLTDMEYFHTHTTPVFRVGDRVLLSDKAGFIPGGGWPVMNSRYHSEGTVIRVFSYVGNGTESDRRYAIKWDNGHITDFYADHLVKCSKVPKYELPDDLFTIEV